ncbi:MAG: AbrB/MazE/SpoVT family DNA-binding domain-containing protein [Oceanospirillales bacterium]|nr:MAG: AbrB/MazE/SpoVT family DNA-binding domain-containing protein [Oceanospirillales bacterium]
MQTRIKKWGKSAAVRLPANILAREGLSVHSPINLEVKDGKIIIETVVESEKCLKLPFTEESLLQDLNAYKAHADELATPISEELIDS